MYGEKYTENPANFISPNLIQKAPKFVWSVYFSTLKRYNESAIIFLMKLESNLNSLQGASEEGEDELLIHFGQEASFNTRPALKSPSFCEKHIWLIKQTPRRLTSW